MSSLIKKNNIETIVNKITELSKDDKSNLLNFINKISIDCLISTSYGVVDSEYTKLKFYNTYNDIDITNDIATVIIKHSLKNIFITLIFNTQNINLFLYIIDSTIPIIYIDSFDSKYKYNKDTNTFIKFE